MLATLMNLMTILLEISGSVNAVGGGIGAGLAVIGAGIGVGMVGGRAMDAMARQPSKMGNIQTNMLIAAALVEGAALFAIVVCLVLGNK